jgi:hypothetical protein
MLGFIETLNGPLGWRVLRNRGRTRAFVSRQLHRKTHRRLHAFLNGSWQPSPPASGGRGLAVSLTSWTPRLEALPLTLLCLLDQKVAARAIFVWLTVEDLDRLQPSVREAFSAHGVSFKTCVNLGPHKKWLPMLQMGYDRPFVICDDDIFYPRAWLGRLLKEDRPDAYVGTRVHRMAARGSDLSGYESWIRDIAWDGMSSVWNFVTGCGGAVIHPKRIGSDFRDWGRIQTECPKADDIWLKAAHLAAGVPVYKTRYSFPCLEIPGTGDSALMAANVDSGDNNLQMGALSKIFKISYESNQIY